MTNKTLIKRLSHVTEEDCKALPAHIEELCHEAADALEDQEWQPIETAPREGIQILGYGKRDDGSHAYGVIYWHVPERSCRGVWLGGHFNSHCPVTHWKPRPLPPEAE